MASNYNTSTSVTDYHDNHLDLTIVYSKAGPRIGVEFINLTDEDGLYKRIDLDIVQARRVAAQLNKVIKDAEWGYNS